MRKGAEIERGVRYSAFISYRRGSVDEAFARWLHRRIETFRVPADLAFREAVLAPAHKQRRFRQAFLDTSELPASPSLPSEIERALASAEFLIVVCSPRAKAESAWMREELQLFSELRGRDRILPVLVDGHPETAFPAGLEHPIPLAADARGKRNWRAAAVALAAGLLGCGLDDLVRRERRRRRVRFGLQVLALFILGGVTALIVKSGVKDADARARRASAKVLVQRIADASRTQLAEGHHERAALLARQAWLENVRHGHVADGVADEALRRVLQAPEFSWMRRFADDLYFRQVAFSSDGAALAAAGEARGGAEGVLVVLNTDDPHGRAEEVLGSPLHPSWVGFDPDGTHLAIAGEPGTVVVYPTGLGAAALVIEDVSMGAKPCWIGPGEIAVPHGDGVRLHRLRSDAEPTLLAAPGSARVRTSAGAWELTVTPDGRRLIGERDDSLWSWRLDRPEAEPAALVPRNESWSIDAIGMTERGGVLAVDASASVVRTLQPAMPGHYVEGELNGIGRGVHQTVAFQERGWLAAVSATGRPSIDLWQLEEHGARHRRIETIAGQLAAIALTGDDQVQLATVGAGHVTLWRIEPIEPIGDVVAPPAVGSRTARLEARFELSQDVRRTTLGITPRVHDLAPFGNGTAVAVAYSGLGADRGPLGYLGLDPDNGTLRLPRFRESAKSWGLFQVDSASSVTLSPDGRWAVCAVDRWLFKWDTEAPDEPADLLLEEDEPIVDVVFSELGDRLVYSTGTEVVRVSLDDASETRWQHSAAVGPLAIVSDTTFFGGRNGTLGRWKGNDPAPRILSEWSSEVYDLAASPDGLHLAAACSDGSVHNVDLTSGEVVGTHRIERGAARCVAWGHSGRRLFVGVGAVLTHSQWREAWGERLVDRSTAGAPTASAVEIFELSSEDPPTRIQNLRGDVSSLMVLPDGLRVVAGTDAGLLYVISLDTGRLADRVCEVARRSLDREEWATFVGPEVDYEVTCER